MAAMETQIGDSVGEAKMMQYGNFRGREMLPVTLKNSVLDLEPYLRSGVVFVANVMEMNWDRGKEHQDGDGHWLVVEGVDRRKRRALLRDPSLRQMAVGAVAWGQWVISETGFSTIAQDCDPGEHNTQETEILEGVWSYLYGLLMAPKWTPKGYLHKLVAKHGGLTQ